TQRDPGGSVAHRRRTTYRPARQRPARAHAQGVRPAGVPRGAPGQGGLPPRAAGGSMATAIDRRRPDHRRSSLLAATKAGRERGETALPAHRAGGRPPVGGAGLRWQLALHAVAVTSIVAIAFLIPLALLVQQVAH